MRSENPANKPSSELKRQTRNKEINPFSEQEKHGDDSAQGREPNHAEEYQGNPSVQRGDHGIEEENEEDTKSA